MKKCTRGVATEGGLGLGAARSGGPDGNMGLCSPPVLRIRAGEGDAVHWVMAAKEEPSRRIMGKVNNSQKRVSGVPGGSAHILTSFGCLSV